MLNPELCTLETLNKYMLNCRDLIIGLKSRQNKKLPEKNLQVNHIKNKTYLGVGGWMEILCKGSKSS